MISSNPKFKELFPLFSHPSLIEELNSLGNEASVQEGDVLMNIGDHIQIMPLVLEGALKIMRVDEEGHEIFLYYIYPGQTCAITLNCCIGSMPSEVRAIAEEHTKLVAVPSHAIRSWMNTYEGWKKFIMKTYHDRFNELLKTIDSIAFTQLDQRLLHFLNEKALANNDRIIHITHQEIANDLNSTREVISRLLKQLEKQGEIQLGRNKIVLL